ncbi:MAG: DUF6515 family protein [Rikenellaceae bacterium]
MKKYLLAIFSMLLLLVFSSESTYAKNSSKSAPTKSASTKSVTLSKSATPSKSTPQLKSSQVPVKGKSVKVVSQPKKVTVDKLPQKSVKVSYRGVDYFRNGSTYYKRDGARFVVVVPPFGIRVSMIPSHHHRFLFGGVYYYYVDGIVYEQDGDDYVSVEPTVGMIVPDLPDDNVTKVNIDGVIYYQFESVLYKQIPTEEGLKYRVEGTLSL